jgi:NADH-quinone oxidoreductase subunit F
MRAHRRRSAVFSCKELVSYYIDPEKCQACLICFRKCTSNAISGAKKRIHVVDQAKCNKCGTCFEVCPARFGAVMRLTGEGEPVPGPIPDELRIVVRKKDAKKEAVKEAI